MTWFTEGVKSGVISAGTVLADTGPLPSGVHSVYEMMLSTSVDAVVRLEWRNAANDGTNISQTFYLSALAPAIIGPAFSVGDFATDERLRVVLANGLLAGAVQASLFFV